MVDSRTCSWIEPVRWASSLQVAAMRQAYGIKGVLEERDSAQFTKLVQCARRDKCWHGHSPQERESTEMGVDSLGDCKTQAGNTQFTLIGRSSRSLPLLVSTDLLARSCIWSLLSLIVWIDGLNSLLVLKSLLGSANDELLNSLLLLDLRSLISDFTITSHGTVDFAHFLFGVFLTK